jgi:hypothetical protein
MERRPDDDAGEDGPTADTEKVRHAGSWIMM